MNAARRPTWAQVMRRRAVAARGIGLVVYGFSTVIGASAPATSLPPISSSVP
jgi:hypothetical protein